MHAGDQLWWETDGAGIDTHWKVCPLKDCYALPRELPSNVSVSPSPATHAIVTAGKAGACIELDRFDVKIVFNGQLQWHNHCSGDGSQEGRSWLQQRRKGSWD